MTRWTDDDLQRLKTLRARGNSFETIGRALGRTTTACRVRHSKLVAKGQQLPEPPEVIWIEPADQYEAQHEAQQKNEVNPMGLTDAARLLNPMGLSGVIAGSLLTLLTLKIMELI